MKRGPQCDTLFSRFWNKTVVPVNASGFNAMTPYYLMRWAFRAGFKARAERERGKK